MTFEALAHNVTFKTQALYSGCVTVQDVTMACQFDTLYFLLGMFAGIWIYYVISRGAHDI